MRLEKKPLLQRIIFKYSLSVIALGVVLVVLSGSFYINSSKQTTKLNLSQTHERVVRILEDKERILYNFTNHLYSNQEALDDIISYFSDDYSNYITNKLDRYYLSDSVSGIDFKSSSKLFFSNDDSYRYSEIVQNDKAYISDYVDKDPLLQLTNPLNFSKNDREIGTINSYYSFQDFERVLEQTPQVYSVVLTPNDDVIWHSDLLSDESAEWVKETYQTMEKSDEPMMNKGKKYYYMTHHTNNGYTFMTIAPIPTKMVLLMPQPLIIIGLFSLTVTFFVLLLGRLFKNYTLQIDSIVEEMTNVKEDPLHTVISLDNKEAELRTVSETVNHLISVMNDYVAKSYVLELKQKDAELRALQSQINPHFLYNTLEFIRMSALKEGNETLSEMVYILGQLFRNTMTQQKEVSLEEEMDMSKLYMSLFQAKYPNKVAYQFTLDPSLSDKLLPKFIIQPFIENYVLHGVDYKKSNNAIQVKAFSKGSELVIQIIDNGKGIPLEEQKNIQEYLSGDSSKLTSVGLKNVNERLKIFFDGNYHMVVTSELGVGTTIQLVIDLDED